MEAEVTSEASKRSRLIAMVVAMATFMLLCAIALPQMETSLVFIPILFLSVVAGVIGWIATRYAAHRSERTL